MMIEDNIQGAAIDQHPAVGRQDLHDLTLAGLIDFLAAIGQPAFRARQVFSWLYRPGIRDFSQMTDIKKELREELARIACFHRPTPEVIERSADGAIKFGLRLADGLLIESVLIPEEDRNTLCVSSQVGCAMDCGFCLTGAMGFKRNLRPAEIVSQITAVIDFLIVENPQADPAAEKLINNLVFMGMGEPLANLDHLLTALDIITEQRGLDFSTRRITVSTCGLIPKLKVLGERSTVNLAISLHSVDDAIRSRLMPVNRTYPVAELLRACREYPLPPRRRIMFEYILIKDLNDQPQDAKQLATALRGIRCKINLLPFNESPALPYQRPSAERIEAFQHILWQAGYSVFVRTSRGADISAACGQLAGRYSGVCHDVAANIA